MVTKLVEEFIDSARLKAKDRATLSILSGSIGQWRRYYEFLQLVYGRYMQTNNDYVTAEELCMADYVAKPSGEWQLSPKEMEEFESSRLLSLKLELECESFIIFSKLLLDRIADTFTLYFNLKPSRGNSSFAYLNSGGFKKIIRKLKLKNSDDLEGLLAELYGLVFPYRNKAIEHHSISFRKGMSWGSNKKVRLTTGIIYPDFQDQESVSTYENLKQPDFELLNGKSEKLIKDVLQFFEHNFFASVLVRGISKQRIDYSVKA